MTSTCLQQPFLAEIPAARHPDKRELFYGTQPADRIQFTTGRDLFFSEGTAIQPLNYFYYPCLEVGGKPWQVKVQTRFSYRDLPSKAVSLIQDN